MYRNEKELELKLPPGLATFIKHGFNHKVQWPLLNVGIVLTNKTTAVNEEWLTAVEHMPTRKIFYNYTSGVLRKEVRFCAYLNKSQTQDKNYVTLYDFDYYVIHPDSTFTKIDKPKELENTLLHTFQTYKFKNIQMIELIAFSSGTDITDDVVERLTFLDVETFNREYNNVKSVIGNEFKYHVPFIVTAPLGKLTFYIDHYPWIDLKTHVKDVLDFLEGVLVADVHSHKLDTTIRPNMTTSAYNPSSGMLYVNDLLTMSVVNFFGCNARLHSYHKFDMSTLDTEAFLHALSKAFNAIIDMINH
ncbi:m117L [Myxoma virus]|uniref:DNA-directed RNA polymerase 35 kDa subunit n=3 Tax=Myxoma virus TaxID=10273 RepID=Q9Q8I4_MYXVL|nr:m117L [Myxoma virus]ACB28912.1 m117L [recombinant virus 6918VP60-T2]AAF15005.1 m117L [Myxoma virus]ACB28740.1 m117L [Myxoma virus]ADK63757.1 m117L [Myxoma virus]AFU77049.1 m117L [Myxoma virus]